MKSVKISCVIPAYNREKVVCRAIDSALSQSHPPGEILVVDDGSTDSTSEVAESFGPSVRVIRKSNGGASSARNLGSREASFEWIAWLDSDDVWNKRHLELITKAIDSTKGRACVYFGDVLKDELGKGIDRSLYKYCNFKPGGSGYSYLEDPRSFVFKSRFPLMLQSSVFSRVAFDAVGGFDESLPVKEDTHAFMKLALYGPFCGIDYISTEMRDDGGSRLSLEKGMIYTDCGISLFSDLRKNYGKHLKSENKRFVSRRLSDYLFSKSVRSWKEGKIKIGLLSLIQAVFVAPMNLGRKFSRKLSRLRSML